MMDVGFKLPTSSKLDIACVSVTLSQSSRVALLGAGAAEKALFLKVLKGQLRPTEGTHMMVQGLVIAHLAPSLLKGLECSCQQTPSEYILARLQNNVADEVKYVRDSHRVTEPLTYERVAQHLLDFELNQQAGILCQLSKSNQARVVLAEAMWPRPHILVLDEFDCCFEQHEIPGLIAAIKQFAGGVLVISSNETFYDAVATEKWNMNEGSLNVESDSFRKAEHEMPVILECGARSLHDSTLNTSESIAASKTTSAVLQSKEYIRGQILEIERKINDAKTNPLTDSESWELFDKTQSLKNTLLFGANAVEVPAGRGQSRVVGVKLTLKSRVAAVGEEGRSISELLLGHRKPKMAKPQRHEGLAVVHLGPHLASAPFASAELAMAAVASELRQKQPQVVILDEARHSGDEVWAAAFSVLLASETVKAFRGAVVFCVAEETPAITSVCSQRWTGDAGWLWQENIESDDFEILEDVAANDGEDVRALLEEVRDVSEEYFNEDSVAKAKSRGWVMSLLTLPMRDGGRTLAGSSAIGCRHRQKRSYTLHVLRFRSVFRRVVVACASCATF